MQSLLTRVAYSGVVHNVPFRSFATLLSPPKPLPPNTKTASGFQATGVRCGIKKKGQEERHTTERCVKHGARSNGTSSQAFVSFSSLPFPADVLDFCLIRSSVPCAAAAVFTQNQFCAAPVLVSKDLLSHHSSSIGGVVINAGCANACTGEGGLKDAKSMVEMSEKEASIPNALVMSTGVIGQALPMEKIELGFTNAVEALKKVQTPVEGWSNASKAIMTTDTQPKCIHRTLKIDGKEYTVSGICKGAGMIHPNMATMLSVIATDISISPECLKKALTYAADRSFNSISIDGDTSTNDTLAILANGEAPAWKNTSSSSSSSNVTYGINKIDSPEYATFQTQLTEFCIDLSQMIVQDGEGVTKFVEVRVSHARTYQEAKIIANSVATSSLVKTALFGQDANWGRILAAVGYAGVPIDVDKVDLFIQPAERQIVPPGQPEPPKRETPLKPLHLVKAGQPFDLNEQHATELFRQSSIVLHLDLGLGQEEATVWTCDLSIDYVKINADYRS